MDGMLGVLKTSVRTWSLILSRGARVLGIMTGGALNDSIWEMRAKHIAKDYVLWKEVDVPKRAGVYRGCRRCHKAEARAE